MMLHLRGDLPSGTVTFLFTDVEGSTRLLGELGAQRYAEALDEHRREVRRACTTRGGLAERKCEEEAAMLWGAVCGAEEVLGLRILAAERRRYNAHLEHLESMPAWTAGKALTLEEAVASIPAAVD